MASMFFAEDVSQPETFRDVNEEQSSNIHPKSIADDTSRFDTSIDSAEESRAKSPLEYRDALTPFET